MLFTRKQIYTMPSVTSSKSAKSSKKLGFLNLAKGLIKPKHLQENKLLYLGLLASENPTTFHPPRQSGQLSPHAG